MYVDEDIQIKSEPLDDTTYIFHYYSSENVIKLDSGDINFKIDVKFDENIQEPIDNTQYQFQDHNSGKIKVDSGDSKTEIFAKNI